LIMCHLVFFFRETKIAWWRSSKNSNRSHVQSVPFVSHWSAHPVQHQQNDKNRNPKWTYGIHEPLHATKFKCEKLTIASQ
jgi:hypothetical protein